MKSLSRLRARVAAHRESGFTLIELMVAVIVFSIFLAITVTSIVALSTSATRIQVAAVSANQELAVFQRLDHQIRYADGINAQGAGASGDIYFEFRTPSDSTSNHLVMCTQWRYDPNAEEMASRSWQDGNFVGTQTPWNDPLNNVANDGGPNYPFEYIASSAGGSVYEEMQLTIDSGNTRVKGAAISSIFVARNSATADSEAGDSVCPAAGDRP